MWRIGIALGCLVWLAGTLAAWRLGPADVHSEPVELHLADGTAIHGTYYHPIPRWQVQPAAVVVHGSAASHRSCSLGLSLPLARNGFHVLAIDLRGHGNSEGSLPIEEFGNVEELLTTQGSHPEVEAALEHLKHRQGVDATRLALVGHSRGGWAAANVGRGRADVRSVVAIGIAPRTCDTSAPQNYLILAGGRDLLSSASACLQAMAAATGGAVEQPNQPFGDWQKGTARRWLVVTRVGHLSELADPAVSRRTVQWICSSFGLDAGKVPGKRLIWGVAALLAATLGGMLAVGGLAHRLGSKAPHAYLAEPPRHAWARWLALIGICLLAVPLSALLTGPIPQLSMYGLSAALGLLLVLTLAISVLARPSPHVASDPSIRQVLTGSLLSVLILIAAGLPWGITWADLVPSGTRLLVGLAMLVPLLPICWLLARAMESFTSHFSWRWHGRMMRGAGWLLLPVLLWNSHALLVAHSQPLFMLPVSFVAAGMLLVLPLWCVAGCSAASRAIPHAVLTDWLLACHLPFVH